MKPAFYSEKQLTEMGLASPMTRWRWRQAGEFPEPIKLSRGRVAYDADAVHAWISTKKGSTENESSNKKCYKCCV